MGANGVTRSNAVNTNQSGMGTSGVTRTNAVNMNQSNMGTSGVTRSNAVSMNQSGMGASGVTRTCSNAGVSSYSMALGLPDSVQLGTKAYMKEFRTMNSPYSVAYIHNRFYTVEKNSVYSYDALSGEFRGKLRVTNFSGAEIPEIKAYRLSTCRTNNWLLIVDKSNCIVNCIDSKHHSAWEIGPQVSARYFLDDPEQAVSNGNEIFICCPSVGIFILVINAINCAIRVVTQTCDFLGIEQPVRIAWCDSADHLVVVDEEDGRYVAHAFQFANCHDVAGGLFMSSEFYVCLASDRTPEIVYLPTGGSGYSPLAVIVDGCELMQFCDESFRRLDRSPLRLLNYRCDSVTGDWERLTGTCWVGDPIGDGVCRLAVCDKRGCRVSLLRLKS